MLSFDQLLNEGVRPMFGKVRFYDGVAFAPEVFESVLNRFVRMLRQTDKHPERVTAWFYGNDTETHFVDPDEQYRRQCFQARTFAFHSTTTGRAELHLISRKSDLEVRALNFDSLAETDELLSLFDAQFAVSKLPISELLSNVTIFIGHGRSSAWRNLKDHLQDQHGLKVEAYETGVRAGKSITKILEEMSSKATFALLVHTGEDETIDRQMNARENVIHETGLFQGKLGFERAIILKEDGTHEFSNIAGLQHLPFSKGNIREVYGDVLATLKREFSHKK